MSEVRRQIAYKRTNILRFLSKAAGHSSPSNRHATVKQDLRVWNYRLSVDGPQTAGLVIQPFQTVAEDVFIWAVGPKRSVNLFNFALEMLLLT